MVMSTAPVSGTLCASTNDQEKKSELWSPRGRWLCEQPSHGLQQFFGVRPQRFPPDPDPVLPRHGEGRPLRRPRAAMLGRHGLSGNLLFPDDKPETDTGATFRRTTGAKPAPGMQPTHFNAEKAKPLRPSLLLRDRTQRSPLLYVETDHC